MFKKLKNFNGVPLKVSMFERFPSSVEWKQLPYFIRHRYSSKRIKLKLGGFDGLVLSNIAKILNFTPQIIDNNDCYGYLLKDGSFSGKQNIFLKSMGNYEFFIGLGSLGDILYRKAIISFNSRSVIDYGTHDIEFTTPVLSDKFCVVTPKAARIPGWMAIFKGFDINVWFSMLVLNCFCGYVWHLLKQFGQR